MALSKEEQERIKNRWLNRNSGNTENSSGKESSTTTSSGTSGLSDEDKKRISDRWNNRFDVDETYINTFVSDANTFLGRVKDDHNKLDYKSATAASSLDYYKSLRQTESDLSTRAIKIQNYLNSRKGEMDEKTYKDFSSYLSSFTSPQFSQSFFDARDYYSQWDSEEAYNQAVAQQKDYEGKKAADIPALTKELDGVKGILDQMDDLRNRITNINNMPSYAPGMQANASQLAQYEKQLAQLEAQYGSYDSIKSQISQKNAYINNASRIQKGIELAGVTGNADFADNSGYVSTKNNAWHSGLTSKFGMGYDDLTYEYINGKDNGMRSDIYQRVVSHDMDTDSYDLYDRMTDEQIYIYNYHYATGGKDAAEEYLDSIIESLSYQEASDRFGKMQGKTGLELLFSIEAGADQFQSGIKNLFSDKDYIPTNATQYTSGMIREDLADVGAKLPDWMGGASIAQGAYDLATTTVNMAPSIMVSAVANAIAPGSGAIVGSALMGASSAGNAYQEALNMGYEKDQARAYSTLVGASEAGLQYLLGGIGKLGGKISGKTAASLASKFDNAFARLAVQYGMNMLSEGGEEYLQEILTPMFKNIALGTDEEINLISEEAIYSFLLGAISSGVMEGTGISSETGKGIIGNLIDMSSKNKANIEAVNLYGGSTSELIQEGLDSEAGSESRQFAEIMKRKTDKGKSMTGYEIRQQVQANEAQFAVENYDSAVKTAKERLTELGETQDVDKVAKLVVKKASGKELTRSEKKTLVNGFGSQVAKEMTTPSQQTEGSSKAYNVTYKSITERVGEEGRYGVAESGETTLRNENEAVHIAEVVTIDDGQMTVKLDDGREVYAGDIDFASDDESRLYSAVADMENMTPAAATALVHAYDPASEQSVTDYVNGIDEAYTYGYYGYSETDLKAGNFTSNLTSEQMMSAYHLGKSAKKIGIESKNAQIVKMRTAAEAKAEKAAEAGKEATKANKMTITYNEGGGNVVDFDKAGVKLTSKQKAAPVLARVMHDMGLGTNFELFSSYLSKTLKDDKGNPARVFLNDEGVEEIAYSGVYRKSDGTIRIDLNAYNGRQLTLNAMAHELTHFIQQWSTEKYEALAEFLVKTYEKTDMTMHERVLREQARLERIRKKKVSYDEAYDEVVANAMSKMLDDGKVMERLTELQAKDASLAKKLWEGLKKLLNKFFRIYSQESALFHDAADLMELKAEFEQLQQMWAEAFVEASENFQTYITVAESQTLAEAGIGFDENTRSMYSAHFSTAYKDEIQVGKKSFDTEAISKIVAKGTGRSIEDARKWVESEMAIANIILQNPEFLDFEADSRYEAIKKNSDYPQGTVDLSNLCPKRVEFTAMFDKLQKAYPNKLFTAQDIADMRKILAKNDITVACGACFVEDRRQLVGEIAETYIGMWKEAVETGKPLQKTNAAGQKSDLLVTKALAKQYGLTPGAKIMATDTYIPNQYDLTTYEGFKLLEKNHPTIAMGFNRYNNSRGQQSARLIEGRAEYNRQILGWSDAKVRSVNNNGGLRIFSFSDFEVVHLLDLVQVIIDCAARGVKIQGYTKIPAFAKLVRGTGIKLNRSLIPKGDYGFHMENGRVVLDYDTTEGIDINDENFIDESDNPDVGNIVIGINPTQIGAAMLDPFIDYIIPFHSNKAKAILEKLGTGKWVNYKESQHEKDISTGTASKHNVNIYTDVLNKYHPKNKVEFVEAFLKECKRQGKIPRYAEFLNVDENGDYAYREGYHKLLVDFKMFDKDGNILPQGNITPNLEESFMKSLLMAEVDKKQNYKFPQKVYDDINKKFGEQYSGHEVDMDADSAYDSAKKETQEDKTNVRREESAEDFDRRTSEGLFRVAQKGQLRYAYRPYLGTAISESAKNAEKELKKLRIPVFIYEKLESNFEGITEIHDEDDSAAIPGVGVFIPFNAVADSKDIVGHEGFHFLAKSKDRADYVSVLVDNIDFPSAGFISYYNYIQEKYFKQTVAAESKESDDSREKKRANVLAEEIFAFITGDIHTGDPSGKVHKFIRDYDAVKNAWDDLLRKQSTDALYSTQETDADYIRYDRRAILKESKVDEYLYDYAAKSSPKYAQAYIAYVRPRTFLKLTTNDMLERYHIADQAGELDAERLSNSRPGIYLRIDHETGKVTGHEGRHRMAAMGSAGIELVPVLLLDTSNKMSKTDIKQIYLHGQFDETAMEIVRDLIPLNYENRDRVVENFATQSSTQRIGERYGLNKTLRFSSHETDNISNRSLLANAFEGITQSSSEYKLIQQYKGYIAELNSLDKKLSEMNAEIRKIRFGTQGARDTERLARLESEAKKIAEAINRYDQKLLWLEASEPIRKVIERERKKEAQKTKDHVKEIQQNKKVRAEQTELRHKIRKAVRDLDKILNRGNKKLNVKEDVQGVVSKALKAADILFTDHYGNYDMLRNGIGADLSDAEEALVATCTRMLKDLDKMPADGYDNFMARQEAEKRLSAKMSKLKDVFARERKRLNNTTVSSILGELADAYASLEKSEQSYVQGAYIEAVHSFLKNLQSEVGGTVVSDMTKDQLESVYAAYKMVLTTVRKANQLFNEGLKMSREQLGNAVIQEVMLAGGTHGLWTKAEIARSQFNWNNMKPVWVANRIGSESFGKLWQGLFEGQYNFAKDIEEAKQFKLEMDKKYKPRSWDAEKQYKFMSSTGKEFSLNLQQIMSLYAFSKREQAYSHLLNGGFVFEGNSTVIVDEKGRKKTYIHNGATSYKLNEATLNGIINSLTKEQMAYVDEMQKYLSEVMGEKGNEVSMQLYGIKMFKEQFYFPLRSSGAYMERAKEAELKKQQGQINLVNSGFTHAVKPEAKNPIILSGFMDVWAEHCNEMSMYHSMVLPMEDFRKVYNYTTVHDEKMESASVYQTIQDAYGNAATAYIDQLYRELNAGATVDPRETPFKALISKFKKASVMMSASVVVQQFSSIGRAYAVIDPRHFTGAKVNSDTKLSAADEMKKYAPVAIIKEMGGFDTGTKGSAKSYIMAEKYGKGERLQGLKKDEQYRSDLMGYLPAKADEKTWCAIWEAAKRETKAKHPKMDVKSEEFLKLAGERFSEVIEKTQVYDSVLARSANMRSKGAFMAMATAFMAEPTTTINLIEDAIRSGEKKHMARVFGSVAVSIVLNNALASIVYAMRDDDEDETFIEKYFQSFTSGMIDDFNPMSYYPFLKDVYSLFQGYDVERADMSVIADVRDALKKAISVIGKDTSEMDDAELAEHNKTIASAFMSLLDAGCSMFGVPFKNVRRDAVGLVNAVTTTWKDMTERDTTWITFWDKVGAAAKDTVPILAWTKDKAKADKLYMAITKGDKDYLTRLKSAYKTDSAYQSAVRKALRENDPRIHEAAQARYEGRTEDYKRIFREIKNEGKFTFDEIMDAVNSEENAIRNKLEPDKATSQYSTSDFVEAIVLGESKSAKAMRDDILAAYVANGKTQEEAEEAFASAVSSSIGDAYSSGLLDKAGAENMLIEYADKDEEEAASKVSYWDFCEKYPQYDLTESRVAKFYEFAEPAGVSVEVYAQFINSTKDLGTIYDEWGDEVESKRDQVLDVIDSLPLTWQQKDALYLAYEYKESTMWDVPW